MLLVLLAWRCATAGTEPKSVLHVESNAEGEIALEAHGATIADTLRAIGSKAGFEVLIDEGIERPPVNVTLSSAPVGEVLHQVLHGRNYAVMYEADDEAPTRVIVLPPSTAGEGANHRGAAVGGRAAARSR